MRIRCPALQLVLAAAATTCPPAQAGRPLVTDDASLVKPGTCETEAWATHRSGQDEYWAVPHCAAGAWELAAGINRLRPPVSGLAEESWLLLAKTLFRPLRRNDWGVGLTLSNQFGGGRGASGDLSAVVPASVSLLDDRLLLHANVGWQRPRGQHSGALWAVAAEWNVARRTGLTLESYGSQHGPAFVQAGARYEVLRKRLTLDAAVGRRASLRGIDHYVTVGLTFTFREP
jgi:hypothetical protein